MMEDALCGNFDLFYGAIGIALFFLSRKQFVFQRDYIEDLLRLINSKAIYDSDTARWPAFDIEKSAVNKAEFNLGFAHGIPSILMFIIKCSEKGFRINASKELVCKGINFLLSFENVQGSRSNFPGLVDFDEPDKHSKYSRLGWCYGDLTIGYTILKAGQHFGKHELKKKGIAILLECAKRKDLSRNYVNDAGFCHGTVGIAQVFYRANLLCPNTDLLEAQNYWTSKTLEQARYMDGMAGYKFFYNEKLIKNTSLIEGIAGVGLFLLSQTSNQPHNWDECFLLS
jgi:lantibiotic modifying enzyme